ncbi:hypothetical protein DAI22_02g215900 [Oryza sativa Japonica Group]|nr:hypothetical protein DAI22_02g215900 [Oryza sativa Japonica Group]
MRSSALSRRHHHRLPCSSFSDSYLRKHTLLRAAGGHHHAPPLAMSEKMGSLGRPRAHDELHRRAIPSLASSSSLQLLSHRQWLPVGAIPSAAAGRDGGGR